MDLAPVSDFLRERIGLEPATLGPTALPRALKARMDALGFTVPADYVARLSADPSEFQELVADVTVQETWFFRGGDLFGYLAGRIAEALRDAPARRPYRILSVPCSTGEEPYSLAIALVEAGVMPERWQIRAVDLSLRHIERARQGRFTDFAFRQTPPLLRQQYFRSADGIWELAPNIRALVQFSQGNLLDPFFLQGQERFDLAFCRNLFIYMHPSARRRALDALDRVLALQGLLCVGHAEPLEFLDARFERAGPEPYFLYRRVSAASRAVTVASQAMTSAVARLPVEPASTSVRATAVDALGEARRLADGGEVDEAMARCEALLAHEGPTADLFSLIGELHQARQETDQALRSFERALYLEPAHYQSLTHLMLLLQEKGDAQQAARLRGRLERLSGGGTQ